MNPVRLMVFYDGNYFKQGQLYFRYKEERGWFSLPELHSLIERYVATQTKSPSEVTKLVAAHYYDGPSDHEGHGQRQACKRTRL